MESMEQLNLILMPEQNGLIGAEVRNALSERALEKTRYFEVKFDALY